MAKRQDIMGGSPAVTAADKIREQLEGLKEHPFSMRTLQSLAQFLTGDKTLKLTPIKGKKWKHCPKTNEILIPARDLQKDGAERRDGLQVLGILLHEIGHRKFTEGKHIEAVMRKARELGLPEKVFSFLHNTVEDPRVNQLMMDEEQARIALDYVYDIEWGRKKSIEMLPTLMEETMNQTQQEKLRNARYKQFGYNIIYYWRHRDFMPGTRPEVKEALITCLPQLTDAIYGTSLNPDDFEDDENRHKAHAENMRRLIMSAPVWDEYVKLVKADITELGDIREKESADEYPPWSPDEEDSDTAGEDQDEYFPQDLESREAPGEMPWQFKIEPAPRESYYRSGVRSLFQKDVRRWRKEKTLSPTRTSAGLSAPYHFTGNVKAGLIALPLPKGSAIDLASLQSDGETEILRDQHGVLYLQSDRPQSVTFNFGKDPEAAEAEPTAEESETLFDAPLSAATEKMLADAREQGARDPEAAARMIQRFIQTTKKYNVSAQGRLYKSAVTPDQYFRRIDQSEELECYTANTFLVALCRRIGIPARMNSGFLVQSRKDNCKKIRKSDGHAWSEIWDGQKWVLVDATPASPPQEKEDGKLEPMDPADAMNRDAGENNEDLAPKMEETDEKERNALEDKEYKDRENPVSRPQESGERTAELKAKEKTDSAHLMMLEEALALVEPHARDIIETLKHAELEKGISLERRRERQRKRKRKHGLVSGTEVSSRQDAIMEIIIGGDRIMSALRKNRPEEEPQNDELNCELAVSIDVSGSMGGQLDDNFKKLEELNKDSHAFLGFLLLTIVCGAFKIPLHGVLFADKAAYLEGATEWWNEDGTLNTEAVARHIIGAFQSGEVGGGNDSNAGGMKLALDRLVVSHRRRQLAIVLSDGDGNTNQFLSPGNRLILEERDRLYALGFGIGVDASCKSGIMHHGKDMSVIEAQFHSGIQDAGHGRTKGFNVGDFTRFVPLIKQVLLEFLTLHRIEFTTDNDEIYQRADAR